MEEGFEEATHKIHDGTNEEEEETSQSVCNKTEGKFDNGWEGKNKESVDQFYKQSQPIEKSDNV